MSRSKGQLAPDLLAERIREALSTLRLGRTRQRFEELLADPTPNASRLEWLWSLLEPQYVARVESRVERRIRESRLPERKTFEAFQFDFQPSLDRDLVLELATLAFMEEGKNVLLAGYSGTGKSHLAMALALNACVENRRVRYTTNADMLTDLNASLADDTLNQALKKYTRPELLVVDEVGLEQVEREVASRSGLLQKVLLPRYKPPRSTIITSNIPWDAWGDYLGDQLGASALVDRLIHRSHIIVIEGPSWRDHEHKLDVERARRSKTPAKEKSKPASGTEAKAEPKARPRSKATKTKTTATKKKTKKAPRTKR